MAQTPYPTQYYLGRVVHTNLSTNESESHLVAISESSDQFEGRCKRRLINAVLEFKGFHTITREQYQDYLTQARDYSRHGGGIPAKNGIVSNATRRTYLRFRQQDKLHLPKQESSPEIHPISGFHALKIDI